MLHRIGYVGFLLMLSAISNSTQAQAPPPPPASPTLWSFLGVPQAFYKLNAQMVNRRGNHPGLEKKPPLKGIADPANLKSEVPAIKAAAEIKQAEDLKPQKIKAIKYLAMIGCGCYDKDEKVTKALLAAMDDCTEDVRLEAMNAVAAAAESDYCLECKQRSCCNEKIVAQLSKVAYEHDDEGCFIEPSERVRQAARDALGVCCADRGGPIEAPTPTPVEGSDRPMPVEGGANPTESTRTPPANDSAKTEAASTRLASSRRREVRTKDGEAHALLLLKSEADDDLPPAPRNLPELNSATATIAPVFKKVYGVVENVHLNSGLIELHLDHNETLPPGATVKVHHRFLSGNSVTGVLTIIESYPGRAEARFATTTRAPKIARGDAIEAWR